MGKCTEQCEKQYKDLFPLISGNDFGTSTSCVPDA